MMTNPASGKRLWERPTKELLDPLPQSAPSQWTDWARQNRHHMKRPPFDSFQIGGMLCDSRVNFALRVNSAPMLLADVVVKSNSSAVKDFVGRQWKRIWSRAAPKIARTPIYGWSAFEAMYREADGHLEIADLEDRHPLECKALTRRGQLAGVRTSKANPENERTAEKDHPSYLLGMKGLWLTYEAKYGQWYGQSILDAAYPPFWSKVQNGGAHDLESLRMQKDAWLGVIVGYPEQWSIRRPDNTEVFGRDIAREMQDLIASGGCVALPTDVNPNTNAPLFTLTRATDVSGATQIFEWTEKLDKRIWEAIVGPSEIVEAGGTGSGFSGRSIPLIAWLMTRSSEFSDHVRAIDRQILRPLVCMNYGEQAAKEYSIDPVDLIEKIGKLLSPDPPQSNTPPPQVAAHGGPMQFSDRPAGRRRRAKRPRRASVDLAEDGEPGFQLPPKGSTLREQIEALLASQPPGLPPSFELIDRLAALIRTYQPTLADLLAKSMLEAWSQGVWEARQSVKPVVASPKPKSRFGEPSDPPASPSPAALASGPPPQLPPEEWADLDELPFTKRAVDDLTTRAVMPHDAFYSSSRDVRQQSFTITADMTMAALDDFRGRLEANLRQGPSWDEFRDRTMEAYDSLPISEAHLENVFRTNMLTALSQGKQAVMDSPEIADVFPYRAFYAIHDTRVRHDHIQLESCGIDGSNIYHKDDPTWIKYQPPFFYQCRCNWTPLTIDDAAAAGIKEAKTWLETGVEPVHPHVPIPNPPPIHFDDMQR